jgi:hypothetical protein
MNSSNQQDQQQANPQSLVLWASPPDRTIAARIGIAGDFLPAGKLTFSNHFSTRRSPHCSPDDAWREMAARLAPHFEDAAISVANLEAALDSSDLPARPLYGLGDIVSAPSACLEYLESIHASILGIANNHIYDFGAEGIARTREAISAREMVALGAGRDLCSEPEVTVWQGPEGIRVGFWAAARATSDPATRHSAGVEPATVARGLAALNHFRRQGAPFCIALLHAGCLRTNYPDPEDVELMDRLAEMGFDIVAASHSHRIGGAKIVQSEDDRQAFCFYGLGSLVSGYVASPAEREGLIVVAALDREGALVQIEVRPVLLGDSGFGEIPSPPMRHAILDRFTRISAAIADGSYERAFYRDMSNGLLRLYVRDAALAFRQFGMRGLARKAARVRMRHMKRLVHAVIG